MDSGKPGAVSCGLSSIYPRTGLCPLRPAQCPGAHLFQCSSGLPASWLLVRAGQKVVPRGLKDGCWAMTQLRLYRCGCDGDRRTQLLWSSPFLQFPLSEELLLLSPCPKGLGAGAVSSPGSIHTPC